MAPFQSGSQEPGESQHSPPSKRSHAAEVQRHEEDGAGGRLSMSLINRRKHLQFAEASVRLKRLSAGDSVSSSQTSNIRATHDKVANSEEHNWPLRIAETGRIDDECEDLCEWEI